MEFTDYLRVLAKNDGSDLYLSTGAPPCGKFQGVLKPMGKEPVGAGRIKDIAYSIMDEEQRQIFEHELEMNLAISVPNVGRFRINIFRQRNEVSIVARNIVTEIPQFDDLRLPEVLKEVIMAKRGLVLFVGGTGSGKSTSLAALHPTVPCSKAGAYAAGAAIRRASSVREARTMSGTTNYHRVSRR